jgi:hypothetical protein
MESIGFAVVVIGILAYSGVALATARFTVKLSVPQYVNVGQTVKVKATGVAGARSHLEVFVTTRNCARSVAAETQRSAHALISKNVLHRYASSKGIPSKSGTYNVCAYLTPIGQSSITRARASATYYGLVGSY